MNTESVNLRRIKVPLADGTQIEPGDFAWDFDSVETGGDRSQPTHRLYLCLPGERGCFEAIDVQRGARGGPRVWGWDGNEDKPTLTPSIHSPGVWHGWLTAGRLVSC